MFLADDLGGIEDYVISHEFGHIVSYRLGHECHKMIDDGRAEVADRFQWRLLANQEELRADMFAIKLLRHIDIMVPALSKHRIEQLKLTLNHALIEEACNDVNNMFNFIK